MDSFFYNLGKCKLDMKTQFNGFRDVFQTFQLKFKPWEVPWEVPVGSWIPHGLRARHRIAPVADVLNIGFVYQDPTLQVTKEET